MFEMILNDINTLGLKTVILQLSLKYFDIVAGVLQGDTLTPYLFIICLDYMLRTLIDKNRENGFELTKKKEAEGTPQKQLPTLMT